jgi:hypothetical protein
MTPVEDHRRHTVTDAGVVVVTTDDEPFIGPIDEDALQPKCRPTAVAAGPEPTVSVHKATCANRALVEPASLAGEPVPGHGR